MAAWFLFISYFFGALAFLVAEFRGHLLTDLFGYSLLFIYFIKTIQFVCSLLLFSNRFRLLSVVILTFLSMGAVGSFIKIESTLAGLPALGYTVLQVWFGLQLYRRFGGGTDQ
jgi:hypothetical protein